MKLIRKQFSKSKNIELENYVELDDKYIKSLTENQKQMLLDDERSKARRNTSKIVKKHADEGKRIGGKKGEKKGKKAGALVGGLGGAVIGAISGNSMKKSALVGGLGGAVIGSGLGYLIGKSAGRASGEAQGHAEGAKKGARIAKSEGHDADERTFKNARSLDEYARKHKKSDHYEKDFRNTLLKEKQEAEERAERARKEKLERERVEAEKRRARAEEERARTDRDRYIDEHYGYGRYSRERAESNPSYTQNNYYYK